MPEVFDKMSAFDDDYASLTDWYVQNPDSGIYTKLDIVSPDMDGTNPSKIFLSIADLMKSDLTSTTSGAANALYSLGVFINYAVQANAFGSLPKRPWKAQGYRAVSAASKTSGLGIAEAQSGLGTAVIPTYVQVKPVPKEIELVTSYTQRMGVISRI